MKIDFINILKQFNGTENVEFKKLINAHYNTPDERVFEIETNEGIFYIFEVDYIGSLQKDVIEKLQLTVGNYSKMYEVKNAGLKFEESGPVKAANVYEKPMKWEEIAKYANDKYGNASYYFNFLFKK